MTIDIEAFLLIGFKKHSLLELQEQKWFNPIKTVCLMTCPDPACAKNPIGKCLFWSYWLLRDTERWRFLADQLTSMCSQVRRRKCPWGFQKLKIWRPKNWNQVLNVSKQGQGYGLRATCWRVFYFHLDNRYRRTVYSRLFLSSTLWNKKGYRVWKKGRNGQCFYDVLLWWRFQHLYTPELGDLLLFPDQNLGS